MRNQRKYIMGYTYYSIMKNGQFSHLNVSLLSIFSPGTPIFTHKYRVDGYNMPLKYDYPRITQILRDPTFIIFFLKSACVLFCPDFTHRRLIRFVSRFLQQVGYLFNGSSLKGPLKWTKTS